MKIIKIMNIMDTMKLKNLKDYLNKIIIYLFILAFIILINSNSKPKNMFDKNEIRNYIKYINDCKNHKRYNRIKIINENPYISICIPALNMNKYIERTVISIINQSFQDFEIVIINDNSKDETEKIIKKLQLEDNRIKLINHKLIKVFIIPELKQYYFLKENILY